MVVQLDGLGIFFLHKITAGKVMNINNERGTADSHYGTSDSPIYLVKGIHFL